jgi:hypothetical protein
MKWLLVVVALGSSNHGPDVVPDAFVVAALYGSLKECKDAVDSLQGSKDSGIGYCFAVDPDKTVGRPVGAIATSGRNRWLPYSVIYPYKFKDQP